MYQEKKGSIKDYFRKKGKDKAKIKSTRNRAFKALTIAGVVVFIALCTCGYLIFALNQRISDIDSSMSSDISSNQSDIVDLRQAVGSAQSEIDDLNQELSDLSSSVSSMTNSAPVVNLTEKCGNAPPLTESTSDPSGFQQKLKAWESCIGVKN